jgi:acyl-CoA reductase-like NAD-dependent aldehyde dehydrogenase
MIAADHVLTIAQQEFFGPVLCMIRYDGEEEAVHIANDTVYGLAGAVWSKDPESAKRVARRLRTGQVDINGASFNPMAPFGRFRRSGHGRENGKCPSLVHGALFRRDLPRRPASPP